MCWQAMKEAAPFIKTEFASFSGDDDYLVPNSLKKGIEFLKSNSSYIAVNGDSLCAYTKENRKKVENIGPYRLHICHEEKAYKRVLALMENYRLPLFSLYRTLYFKEVLSFIPKGSQYQNLCPVWAIVDEYLPSSISAGLGKVTTIQGLWVVRTIHMDQYLMTPITDNEKKLNVAINYYKKCLVKLFERDNLTHHNALEISNQIGKIIVDRARLSEKLKQAGVSTVYKYKLYYFLSFFKKALKVLFFYNRKKSNVEFYLNKYEHAADLEKIHKSLIS